MAESSGLYTTDATPSGHQVVSYTQAIATDMLAIAAACSGFEGVAPGYLSELAPSTTGAFTVRIAAGGAMVDGKYYKNTANVDKTLDTPTAGTTRIDRVVVEITWASFECVITVIKGTESGGTPSAPSIPSTAGTNYAIQICQALVNNAGDVTITDERTWAAGDDNSLTTGAVTLAKLAADSVDDTKAGNRVPQFYRRQGGHATSWADTGTTTYTPGAVRMQAGAIAVTGSGTVTVTYPVAFSYNPIVIAVGNSGAGTPSVAGIGSVGATTVQFYLHDVAGNATSGTIYWLAIGTE